MGGGIHVSAGGFVYLQTTGGGIVQLLNNRAATSGGGLSVKSGRAYIEGATLIQGNSAVGAVAAGYGNGGGIFVTTSYYDDNPFIPGGDPLGAGFWAAIVYGEQGFIQSLANGVSITGNSATRWGGGLYAGLSDPWHNDGPVPPRNLDNAKVTVKNASILNNTAGLRTRRSALLPAQVAAERVQGNGTILDFGGTTIGGAVATDIGIYTWDSIAPAAGTVFLPSLAATWVNEVP